MASAPAVALRPNNEATRPARAGAERATTNYVPSDVSLNNLFERRSQYLVSSLGMAPQRASVVASMAWEVQQ